VRVHLRGRKLRVPEHLLDVPDVGAVLEQDRRNGGSALFTGYGIGTPTAPLRA
jgi:hypothetical protein